MGDRIELLRQKIALYQRCLDEGLEVDVAITYAQKLLGAKAELAALAEASQGKHVNKN